METKQPKVLILSQLFYPELVSTGQTLTELAEELVKQGMQVDVICGQSTQIDSITRIPTRIKYKKITINRVSSTRLSKFNLLYKMINQLTYTISLIQCLIIDRSKKVILVFTNPSFAAFVVALSRKLGGSPYIFTIYDVHPDAAFKMGLIKKGNILVKLWDYLNRFAFKHSSGVVVLGRCMYEKMVSPRKIGSSKINKLHIINIWSDDRLIKAIPPSKNRLISEWGLTNKFIVGYSGNFGRFHDLETIMKAVKGLIDYRQINFLFIGEGYKKNWCIDYAEKWQLKNCHFYTYVDRKDLALSHSLMDIGLVSLSLGQEGLSVPSKMYGILASETPVIAVMSNNSETSKMIEENKCGISVKPGDHEMLIDKILFIYNNDAQKIQMGKNGRKAIDSVYNVRNASNKYLQLINKISNQEALLINSLNE